MGTRRLWLVVLLTLLQYAAVRAEPSSCRDSISLDNWCNGLDKWAGCDTVDITPNGPLSCSGTQTLFFKRYEVDTTWMRESKIICDQTRGRWMAEEQKVELLDWRDRVVCTDIDISNYCTRMQPLISNCTGLESFGCQEIDITTDATKSCQRPKILYAKSDWEDDKRWKKSSRIECSNNGESWVEPNYWARYDSSGGSISKYTVRPNEEVICADSNPSNISCQIATPIVSVCDSSIPESVGCEEIPDFSSEDEFCKQYKFIFFKQADGNWKTAEKMSCNGQFNWEVDDGKHPTSLEYRWWGGPTAPLYLNAGDNVICGDLAEPCWLCTKPYEKDCDHRTGCVKGGPFVYGNVGPTPSCEKITCPYGEFFWTGYWSYRTELICDGQTEIMVRKWRTDEDGGGISAAVCVKKLLCIFHTKLKSNCSGLDAWGCVEVDLTNDDDKICDPPKTMFFKSAAGTMWEETPSLHCDDMTGVWRRGPNGHQIDTQSDDQVICANANPSLELCKQCAPVIREDFLACEDNDWCKTGGQFIEGIVTRIPSCERVTCPENEFLAVRSGAFHVMGVPEIECNSNMKWIVPKNDYYGRDDINELPIDAAICIKESNCSRFAFRSNCTGLEAWGCENSMFNEFEINPVGPLRCGNTKTLYYKYDDATPWTAETGIICDRRRGYWLLENRKQEKIDGGQIICADADPSKPEPGPCKLCPSLLQADCNPTDGCVSGGPFGVERTSDCKKLTCPYGEFFLTDNGTSRKELICNDEKMWTINEKKVVDKAICIKKFSCIIKNPLKSDCTGLNDWECTEVDLTKDDYKECKLPSDKKMFFKTAAGTTWEEISGIHCDEMTGVWRGVWGRGEEGGVWRRGQEIDIQANDQVVCAAALPSPDPCEQCFQPTQIDCKLTDGCEIGGPIIEGTVAGSPHCKKLTCPYGEYLKTNQGFSRKEIMCNNERKWAMNGKKIIDKAACIKKISCIVKTPLKSDCTGLDAWGCVEVDFTNDSNKVCALQRTMFFKNAAGTTWEETSSLSCDEMTGVWKRGQDGKQIGMQIDDQVICAAINPSQRILDPCEQCSQPPQIECKPTDGCELGGPIIEGTVAGSPHCKKLTCLFGEYLITNQGFSRKEVICDSERKWMMNGDKIIEEAVCIKRVYCISKTPLKSDCTGLDAWGCVEVDLTNDNDKECESSKIMLFKTVAGTTWEVTSNLFCDEITGVWKRGPDGQQVDMQDNEHVICADSNPSQPSRRNANWFNRNVLSEVKTSDRGSMDAVASLANKH